VRELVREISVVFGDGRAADAMRDVAASAKHDLETRRRAVRTLIDAGAKDLAPLFEKLLGDRDLSPEAVRGLSLVDPSGASKTLIRHYGRLSRAARLAVVEALSSRVASAGALLDAVENGTIEPAYVSPFQLRRLQLFEDAGLNARLAKLWPDRRLLGEDKLKRIASLRPLLSPERRAAADPLKGREIFLQSCGKCHKLFGEGGAIGPDLTGGQRGDPNYLLENIVDPSASVAAEFRISVVQLHDDRILNGVIVERTERTLALQTPDERLVLDLKSVARTKASELSLMPEGLLDALAPEQIADLFAYVMAAQPPAR
jgi:putative heme-binding domain-containing protein